MTAYNVSMDHFGPLFCRQALLWVVLPTGSLSGPPTRHEDQRAKKGRPDDLTTCWPIVVPRVLTIQQKVGPGIRALRFSTLVVPRWLLPGAKTDTGTGGSGASPGMIGAFDLGSEEVVIGCSERVEASRGASYHSFSSHVLDRQCLYIYGTFKCMRVFFVFCVCVTHFHPFLLGTIPSLAPVRANRPHSQSLGGEAERERERERETTQRVGWCRLAENRPPISNLHRILSKVSKLMKRSLFESLSRMFEDHPSFSQNICLQALSIMCF